MAKKRQLITRIPIGRTPPLDRVSLIRQMLEENKKTDLYSPNYVSTKPWDLAARKFARTGTAPGNTFFDPSKTFSKMKITVVDGVEQNDKVVIRWRLQGTWTGAFGPFKATRRPVDVTGVNIYRFVGDKIVEETGEMDWATFAVQVFGAPSAGGGPPTTIAAGNAAACQRSLAAVSRPPELVASPGGLVNRRGPG